MITVELTNEEAEAFKVFREHQDFFVMLIESDVHKLNNGNAVLSFDGSGLLRKIRLDQVVYST